MSDLSRIDLQRPSLVGGRSVLSERLRSLRSFRQSMNRPIGIPELDRELQGGLPNASCVALEGSGEPVLVQWVDQFAATGLALGESVHYFTLRPSPSEVQDWIRAPGVALPPQARLLVHDLRKTGVVPELAPQRSAPVPLSQIVSRQLLSTNVDAPYRAVLDSLDALVEREGLRNAVATWARLSGILHSSNGVLLACVDPARLPEGALETLHHGCDGILSLSRQGPALKAVIQKMRGRADLPRAGIAQPGGDYSWEQ